MDGRDRLLTDVFNEIIMKKLILLLAAGVMLANIVSAEGGTCSWHGGINCNLLPDWDGSVICNDGWRDSSENYISSSECAGIKHFCTLSEYQSLQLKFNTVNIEKDYRDLLLEISQIDTETNNQIHNIETRPGIVSSQVSTATQKIKRDADNQKQLIQSQIESKQYDLNSATGQVNTQCELMGQTAFDKKQQENQEKYTASLLANINNKIASEAPKIEAPAPAIVTVVTPIIPVVPVVTKPVVIPIIPKTESVAVKEVAKTTEPVLEIEETVVEATTSSDASQIETASEPAPVAPVITPEPKKEPNFIIRFFKAIRVWFGGMWR